MTAATILQTAQILDSADASRLPRDEEFECELCEVPDPDRDLRIVEQWHNEAHPGVFRFCDEQPCHALNHAPLVR